MDYQEGNPQLCHRVEILIRWIVATGIGRIGFDGTIISFILCFDWVGAFFILPMSKFYTAKDLMFELKNGGHYWSLR